MFGRCTNCGRASEHIAECVITINGRRKAADLCTDCRAPLELLRDSLAGHARGRTNGRVAVAVDPQEIPLDRPPTLLRPVRKRK